MEGSSNNNNNNEMIMSSPPPSTTPSPCSSQGGPNSPCSTQQGAAGGPPIIMSPCAACKILRRRCAEKCVLAPYFPPTDPLKFTIAHKVFGASNIIKLLQELLESQRADAVSSMVYEANARLRDPVYGSAGAICQLQQQVSELQAELAKSRAEIVNLQCQHANLLALICMEMTTQSQSNGAIPTSSSPHNEQNQSSPSNTSFLNYFYDDNNTTLSSLWEPLWT